MVSKCEVLSPSLSPDSSLVTSLSWPLRFYGKASHFEVSKFRCPKTKPSFTKVYLVLWRILHMYIDIHLVAHLVIHIDIVTIYIYTSYIIIYHRLYKYISYIIYHRLYIYMYILYIYIDLYRSFTKVYPTSTSSKAPS